MFTITDRPLYKITHNPTWMPTSVNYNMINLTMCCSIKSPSVFTFIMLGKHCDQAGLVVILSSHTQEVHSFNLSQETGYLGWCFFFFQFLHANANAVPELGLEHILQNYFQFIIHLPSYHWLLLQCTYWWYDMIYLLHSINPYKVKWPVGYRNCHY
jgi:hypothetical protein